MSNKIKKLTFIKHLQNKVITDIEKLINISNENVNIIPKKGRGRPKKVK